MTYDPDRAEKITNLVERYRASQFSEVVFTASLKAAGMRPDEIKETVNGIQKPANAAR